MSSLRRNPSRDSHGLSGLTNLRLSCCANTVLQMLAATWELGALLSRWRCAACSAACSAACCAACCASKVPCQLRRCLEAMSRGDCASAHLDLLRCLHRNRIELGVQQDAHEVFLCILGLLQQQLDDAALALDLQNLYKISVETRVRCGACTSVKTLSSFLLTLPLSLQGGGTTVDDCLQAFLQRQLLTGPDQCFCIQCEMKTPAEKVVRLLSLPPILCLHLQRFRIHRGFTRKLDGRVSFPETLDLSAELAEGSDPSLLQSPCRYTLFAVAVHCGTAVFGHYTAFVRDQNQRWFYTDDSHVRQVTWGDVQASYGGRYRSVLLGAGPLARLPADDIIRFGGKWLVPTRGAGDHDGPEVRSSNTFAGHEWSAGVPQGLASLLGPPLLAGRGQPLCSHERRGRALSGVPSSRQFPGLLTDGTRDAFRRRLVSVGRNERNGSAGGGGAGFALQRGETGERQTHPQVRGPPCTPLQASEPHAPKHPLLQGLPGLRSPRVGVLGWLTWGPQEAELGSSGGGASSVAVASTQTGYKRP
ncbi:ubl carboxyl-terminal hydrolase 18 [Neosynchiropus ocellatus]